MSSLTEPAKCLLLVALLAKDHIISNNGKAFLKELILRRDPRLTPLISKFEAKQANGDVSFLEQIHDLIATEAQAVYDELFVDTSLEVGKMLSKYEREEKHLSDEKSLIYGEVDFTSFYRILRKVNPLPGTIFYDLGSGTGKALFIARFTQDFSNCIGIEILHDLHQQAVTIAERYRDDFQDTLCLSTPKDVSVVHDSLLDVDWSDGNVIFANSTCFSDELMHQLSIQAEACAPGTVVITFTKGLTSRGYELLEKKRYKMSWGPATVFIHCRLAANGKSVGRKLNILPSDSITYEEPQPEDDSSVEDEEEEEEDEEEDGGDEDGDEDDGDDENDSESSDVDPQFGTYPPRPPAHATAPAAHAHANANAPPTPPTHTPVVHPTPSPLRVPTPRSSANKADSKTTPDTSFTSVDAKASPSWRTRADSKMTSLSPASPGAKSSISVPTELASQQAFNMLNSPLDEALLNRKRSGRKLVVDSDSEQG